MSILRIFFIFSDLLFSQFRLTRLVKNYCFVHLFKYLCIYLISRCPLSTRWSFSNSSSSSAPHDSVASSDLLSGNLFNFRNNYYLLLLTKPVFKEVCMCVLLLFFSQRDIFYFKLKSAW